MQVCINNLQPSYSKHSSSGYSSQASLLTVFGTAPAEKLSAERNYSLSRHKKCAQQILYAHVYIYAYISVYTCMYAYEKSTVQFARVGLAQALFNEHVCILMLPPLTCLISL